MKRKSRTAYPEFWKINAKGETVPSSVYYRDYYSKNRSKARQRSKNWRDRNIEKERQRIRLYGAQNKERINAQRLVKYRSDARQRLTRCLRGRLRQAIQRNYKHSSVINLLGCSLSSLMFYLESKFETGWTWENYGSVWEVDHIVPCALFDFARLEHQKRCFHFSNLQPMEASQNRKKGKKLVWI